MAGLEAAGRHHVGLVAQLQFEETQRPLQYEVRTVVKRLQRRLDGVAADQHETGTEQLVWQLGGPGWL